MAATLAFEDILAQQRETMLDTQARALAGVQGRPPGSEAADDDDEFAAWTTRDPNVGPEHLAQIAAQTDQELRQQADASGRPVWSDEQIERAIRGRQTAALFPYRHLTYTVGVHSLADQIKRARQVAEKVQRRQERERVAALAAAGWEPVEEMALGGSAPEEQAEWH